MRRDNIDIINIYIDIRIDRKVSYPDDYVNSNGVPITLTREYNKQENTDFLLKVVNDEGTHVFKVHKQALINSSEILADMFAYSEETASDSEDNYVPLLNDDKEAMKELLFYIYNDYPSGKYTDYMELFRISNKYKFTILRDICQVFLFAEISHENFVKYLEFAKINNADELYHNMVIYYNYFSPNKLSFEEFLKYPPEFFWDVFETNDKFPKRNKCHSQYGTVVHENHFRI